ncbi:MAG TPA: hypothetical protein VIG62_25205 [Blastocatellia bacterium]|jgi:hypothetical protein
MDTGMVFALILTVLFLGGITWLVIHSRLQNKKDAQGPDRPPPDGKAAPGKLKTN